MRYASAVIFSAAIPATVVVAAWPPSLPTQIAVKTVVTEGVREQRMDTETFRARWTSVSDMPPTLVWYARNRERDHLTSDRIIEGDAVNNSGAGATRVTPAKTGIVARTVSPSMIHRRARLDVCARHNMRRVTYGKRWRCRR